MIITIENIIVIMIIIIIILEKEKLGGEGGVSPGGFEFFHETQKINYRKNLTWGRGKLGEVFQMEKLF